MHATPAEIAGIVAASGFGRASQVRHVLRLSTGTGAGGSGRRWRLALLLDLRRLPAEVTKVVQLGPPDIAAGDHLYLGDVRSVYRKGALHALHYPDGG